MLLIGVRVGRHVQSRRDVERDVVIDELTEVGVAGGDRRVRAGAGIPHQAAELPEQRLRRLTLNGSFDAFRTAAGNM